MHSKILGAIAPQVPTPMDSYVHMYVVSLIPDITYIHWMHQEIAKLKYIHIALEIYGLSSAELVLQAHALEKEL